jgi:hypothetical protein
MRTQIRVPLAATRLEDQPRTSPRGARHREGCLGRDLPLGACSVTLSAAPKRADLHERSSTERVIDYRAVAAAISSPSPPVRDRSESPHAEAVSDGSAQCPGATAKRLFLPPQMV